jgi:hypothetical protein
VINDKLILKNIDEDHLRLTMEKMGYDPIDNFLTDTEDDDMSESTSLKKYQYLLSLNVRSFTKQKMTKLQEDFDELTEEFNFITNTTPADMWLSDIKELERQYKSI